MVPRGSQKGPRKAPEPPYHITAGKRCRRQNKTMATHLICFSKPWEYLEIYEGRLGWLQSTIQNTCRFEARSFPSQPPQMTLYNFSCLLVFLTLFERILHFPTYWSPCHVKIRRAPGPGRVRSSIIISSILLFFICIIFYLIYQVYPARARAPLGAPGAKVRPRIVPQCS